MNSRCSKYELDISYPPIRDIYPNRCLAAAVYSAYAGSHSEFTAVTTYFYRHLIASKENCDDIAEAYECISRTEMIHLEVLGKLLLCLGYDPKLICCKNNSPKYWCSSNIDFTKSLCDMLRDSIRDEGMAIENYKRMLHLTCCDNTRAIIERIIMDEKHHLEIFQMLYCKYCNRENSGKLPHHNHCHENNHNHGHERHNHQEHQSQHNHHNHCHDNSHDGCCIPFHF